MYDMSYLDFKEMQAFLGVSRNRLLTLCQTKPHGFPVARIGHKYQADRALLEEWKNRLYKGEFTI